VGNKNGDDYDPLGRSGFERMPPWDLQAEQWCLGGCMIRQDALTEIVELLEPEDFYRQAHQMIYSAIVSLWAQAVPVDPITLKAELESRKQISQVGSAVYLAELYGLAGLSFGAVHHAQRVRELSAKRQVLAVGMTLCQRVHEADQDLGELVAQAQADVSKAVMTAATARGHKRDLLDLDAFCSAHAGRQPTVIPGLLDAQDRALIVGLEGDGKSMLGMQVGFGAAAGIHPFVAATAQGATFEPCTVVIVDLENPEYLIQRRAARMREWVSAQSSRWRPSNMLIVSIPGGVDLTRASDCMRLADTIRLAAPALVVAGPIYKMMQDRGQGAEELHSQVANFWDTIRQRYGCALWIETHAPGPAAGKPRELYPYGWSGWRRWCEFGLTLERGAKGKHEWRLGRFKGDREEGRMWPEKLTRSTAGGASAPWQATYPAGTFQGRLDDAPGWDDQAQGA
jgi:hypothetical protein